MVFFTSEEEEIISKIILKKTGNYIQARKLAELYKISTGLSIDTFDWEIIDSSLRFEEQKEQLLEIIKSETPRKRIYTGEHIEQANIENLVEAILSNVKELIKEDKERAEETALAIVREFDVEIPFTIKKEYDELKEEYENLKEKYDRIYESFEKIKKEIFDEVEKILEWKKEELTYNDVEAIVKHYVSQIKDEYKRLQEEFERLSARLKYIAEKVKEREPRRRLKFRYIQCPICGAYKIVPEDVVEFFRRSVGQYRIFKRNLKRLDMKDLLTHCASCYYNIYAQSFNELRFFPIIYGKNSIIEDVLNFTLGFPYLDKIFYDNVRALGYTSSEFRALLRMIKEKCTPEEVREFEEEIKKAKRH